MSEDIEYNQNQQVLLLRHIARRCVERATSLNYRGKRRDEFALDYFIAAYTGIELIGFPEIREDAMTFLALVLSTHGYAEVQRLAAHPLTKSEESEQNKPLQGILWARCFTSIATAYEAWAPVANAIELLALEADYNRDELIQSFCITPPKGQPYDLDSMDEEERGIIADIDKALEAAKPYLNWEPMQPVMPRWRTNETA